MSCSAQALHCASVRYLATPSEAHVDRRDEARSRLVQGLVSTSNKHTNDWLAPLTASQLDDGGDHLGDGADRRATPERRSSAPSRQHLAGVDLKGQ